MISYHQNISECYSLPINAPTTRLKWSLKWKENNESILIWIDFWMSQDIKIFNLIQYTKVYDKDFRLNTKHIIKFLIQLSKSQSTKELKITYMERQNSNSQKKKNSRSQDDSSKSSNSVNGSQPRKSLKMETDLPELPLGIPQYIIDYVLLRKMITNNQLHKYPINGIVLYFPHKQPNAPQKKFISKMFESLENGLRKEETQRLDKIRDRHKMQNGEQVQKKLYHNNLLIESSTGTGKTLALLYGSMSWAEHKYIEKMKVFLEQLKKKEITQKYFDYQAIIAQRKIIYSSRAHSQLSQISKQLEKTPFRPNMLIFGGKQKLCINEVVKFQNKIAKQNQKFQEWQKKCGSALAFQRMFKGNKKPQYMKSIDLSKSTILDLKQKLTVYKQRMDQQMLQDFNEASKIVTKYLYKERNISEERNIQDYFGIGQNQQPQQNNANNINQRRQGNQNENERRDYQRRIRQEENLRKLRPSNRSRHDAVTRLAEQMNRPIQDQESQPDAQDQNDQQENNTKNNLKSSSNSKKNINHIYNQRYQKKQSNKLKNNSDDKKKLGQTTNNKAPKRMRAQDEGPQPSSDSEEKRQVPRNNSSSGNQNQRSSQPQPQPQQPSGGNSSPQQSLKSRLLALEKLHFLISKVYPIYTNRQVTRNIIKEIDSQYQHLLSMESRCPHFRPYIKGENNDENNFFGSMKRKLLNNETLAYYAAENIPSLCPHFYPKRVRYMGTLYLMPYNYLLTQIILQRTGDLFKNAIVIFDEGHNVTDTACKGYSMKMMHHYFKDAFKNIHDKDQDEDKKKLNRKNKKIEEKESGNEDQSEEERLKVAADELQDQEDMARKYLQEKKKNIGKNPNDDPHGADYFDDEDNNEQVPNQQHRSNIQALRIRREKQLRAKLTAIILNHSENFQNFFRNQIRHSEFKQTTEYRRKYFQAGMQFQSQYWTEFKQYNNDKRVDNMDYIRKLLFNDPTLTQESMKKRLNELISDLKQMIEIKIEKYNQIQEHNKTHREKIYQKIYYFKIAQLQHCYKKIQKLFFNQGYKKKFYLRLAQSKMKLKDGQIKYKGMVEVICLSPEFAMQALQTIGPLSMILTSGTLKPTDLLKRELAIQFTDGGHAGQVIDEKNTCIRIVRRFIDINKSSENKVQDDQSQVATINSGFYDIKGKPIESNLVKLIRTLIEIIREIPNGVLLMFSSKLKVNCIQRFLNGATGKYLLLQLKKIKPYVGFETEKDIMKNVGKFKKDAVDKGALMFCVCRGKLSQGIDFKDKLCRGVIFIGVPVLPFEQPALIQKSKYMKQFYQQYEKTYQYIEVAKSINQSLGRVVRHQFDYGSIILLDDRYANPRFPTSTTVLNLSKWIMEQCQSAPSVQHLKKQLSLFFVRSKQFYSQFHNEDDIEIQEVQKNYAQELRPVFNGNNLPVIHEEQLFHYARRNPIKQQQFMDDQPIDPAVMWQNIQIDRPARQSRQQLYLSVKNKGFTHHDVESDGNCLFRTLSLLITRNTQLKFAEYRKKIMDELCINKNQLKENIAYDWKINHPRDQQLTDDVIFDKYIAHYSKNRTMGGATELQMASKLKGFGFMIHTKEGTESIRCSQDIRLTEHNLFHIAFLTVDENQNKNHYMALKPNGSSFINASFNKNKYLDKINLENTKNGKALVM